MKDQYQKQRYFAGLNVESEYQLIFVGYEMQEGAEKRMAAFPRSGTKKNQNKTHLISTMHNALPSDWSTKRWEKTRALRVEVCRSRLHESPRLVSVRPLFSSFNLFTVLLPFVQMFENCSMYSVKCWYGKRRQIASLHERTAFVKICSHRELMLVKCCSRESGK